MSGVFFINRMTTKVYNLRVTMDISVPAKNEKEAIEYAKRERTYDWTDIWDIEVESVTDEPD